MVQLKSLAPTILDAIKAVEQGCRKVQDDPYFVPDMTVYMKIKGQVCLGCLATCTLLHLSNKSTIDIINSFSSNSLVSPNCIEHRSEAYGIIVDKYESAFSDISLFESAIDGLRSSDLRPLLEVYQLEDHSNANKAAGWLIDNQSIWLKSDTTKEDLLRYADFLQQKFIPKLEQWFIINK